MAWHYHVYSSCSFFSCVLYVWNLYCKNRCMCLYKVLQMSYFPDCFHFGLRDANTFKPSMPCPIPAHASLVCVLSTSFLLFFSPLFFSGTVTHVDCCLNFLFPQELGRKFKSFVNRFRWIFVNLIACVLMDLYSLVFRQKATTPTQPDLRSSSDVFFFFFFFITMDLFGFWYWIDVWMISLAPVFSGFDKWTNIKGQERWMEILPQHSSPLAMFSI